MDVTFFLSIIWIIYGIAGLLGYQNIPEKYKGYSWTVQYKQLAGIGWLILAIPSFVSNFLIRIFTWPHYINLITIILSGAVSIVYSRYQEKKFSKILAAEQIEVKDTENE